MGGLHKERKNRKASIGKKEKRQKEKELRAGHNKEPTLGENLTQGTEGNIL